MRPTALALLVGLGLATPTGAQSPTGAPTSAPAHPARWRFELDSADWRYRLTIRVALDAAVPTTLVLRTSGTDLPHRALRVRGRESETHFDPDFVLAWLEVGRGPSRVIRELATLDTVTIDVAPPLTQGSILRGRYALHTLLLPGDAAAGKTMASVAGEFVASFDPTPVPRPTTMTDSLQTAILKRALWDAGLRWLDAQVHIRTADSTHDPRLLRAYLTSRYGSALVVDAVSSDARRIVMRVRGRYRPITCESDDGRIDCPASWMDRVRGVLRSR